MSITPDYVLVLQKHALLDDQSRLVRWPKKSQVRLAGMSYLASKFSPAPMTYSEGEVNELIIIYTADLDYALIRRELIVHGMLSRKMDGSCYWRTADMATGV